ncbi:hypothetical protein J2X34_001944 [Rhodococcus sp. BE178]
MHTTSYPQRMSQPMIRILDRTAENPGNTAGFSVP